MGRGKFKKICGVILAVVSVTLVRIEGAVAGNTRMPPACQDGFQTMCELCQEEWNHDVDNTLKLLESKLAMAQKNAKMYDAWIKKQEESIADLKAINWQNAKKGGKWLAAVTVDGVVLVGDMATLGMASIEKTLVCESGKTVKKVVELGQYMIRNEGLVPYFSKNTENLATHKIHDGELPNDWKSVACDLSGYVPVLGTVMNCYSLGFTLVDGPQSLIIQIQTETENLNELKAKKKEWEDKARQIQKSIVDEMRKKATFECTIDYCQRPSLL